MLVHRLRRWPNIEPTMAQCLVIAGMAWSYIVGLSYNTVSNEVYCIYTGSLDNEGSSLTSHLIIHYSAHAGSLQTPDGHPMLVQYLTQTQRIWSIINPTLDRRLLSVMVQRVGPIVYENSTIPKCVDSNRDVVRINNLTNSKFM